MQITMVTYRLQHVNVVLSKVNQRHAPSTWKAPTIYSIILNSHVFTLGVQPFGSNMPSHSID